MNLLPLIATRSLDPNTKFGCVIAGKDNRILSTGYNSFPAGANDTIAERFERPAKYKFMVHAEANAIYTAARHGVSLIGARLFVGGIPCMNCCHAIIQAGIADVYYDALRQRTWNTPQYATDFELSVSLMKECGVRVKAWEPGK